MALRSRELHARNNDERPLLMIRCLSNRKTCWKGRIYIMPTSHHSSLVAFIVTLHLAHTDCLHILMSHHSLLCISVFIINIYGFKIVCILFSDYIIGIVSAHIEFIYGVLFTIYVNLSVSLSVAVVYLLSPAVFSLCFRISSFPRGTKHYSSLVQSRGLGIAHKAATLPAALAATSAK